MQNLSCFKAYDIRGEVPLDLNNDLAYRIGRAYASEFTPKNVVVGHDIRLESPDLSAALCRGLTESGVEVWHLGLCGTEEVYFATSHYQADGGIMITASHNPKGNNGMKLVTAGSKPISKDTGLLELKRRVLEKDFVPTVEQSAQIHPKHDKSAYIQQLLSYIDLDSIKPFKVVVNAGNGAAGPTFDLLAEHLPCEFIRINHEADGNFPNGVPNPMIPENRKVTADAVIEHHADFAVAWDGDFDRCFLFDENGGFIEGYYLIGLLAETLLKNHPGAKIVYDPRLTWNTIEQVTQAGGVPVQSKTGHAFIKEHMRKIDALYGGEMSAHHYFKDFFFCDSGMIPWLLIMQLMSRSGKSLNQLIRERAAAYPCSGELNYKVEHSDKIIAAVREHYADQNPEIDLTDGVGLAFAQWRLNIRTSNTEPLLRLNVESRGDPQLVAQKVKEVEAIIDQFA
ncbi:phosphomannomutase [Thiomicrorhabdus xiamenensis]|uniref:phosphomannomutase n=1 Tax=Thiomicrorhabdus xiamenensis TaxID=2739063 RepID=A0A7D4NRD0_9GAMM|nr:phosphomannomutase [Thiomicrorhabdus xiamenensis]QKI89812.1 phosphomannomutase [Thiomicrorhabdus xiamenensis]